MALPPKTDEAFLREVDEELRRDQLAGFWVQWGKWIAAAVVAGLAIFAGFLAWQHHQATEAGLQGEQLQAAYDSLAATNTAAAQKPLADLAQSHADGYRALAKFTQADVLLQKNDTKGAAAGFAAIAADTSLAKPFRDLALVRQTASEYDTLKPQVVVERLRPLATPGNAWFGSAGEMVAIAYLKMNRKDLAGRLFSQVAQDEGVPATVRQRAVQMAAVLGTDAAPQIEGSKAQ